VRNVQVIPADEPQRLEGLKAWRRRGAGRCAVLGLGQLAAAAGRQVAADARKRWSGGSPSRRRRWSAAAALVKPGGRLVYVTCSVLPEENADQVTAFLARHPDFAVVPYAEVWRAAIASEPPPSADGSDQTLLLTPARHDTDGFFILVRGAGAANWDPGD
jgi:16S rRNA (cytosine967-C5)-methyltransferase